ncbi:hypothetical protein K458DRAFT_391633 [Lentithecium fluviatile CBS 122367]|uniref:Uncharacterized protein n=1 Tax=Lentithecium fluviatile CBS 122367 TaxID=1168545 RepID=A0A6G1IUQ7_9PLEO|nr:hypothetical protein K458DRAFT_391633 [Lentithecium fluviatile CBS 122367]
MAELKNLFMVLDCFDDLRLREDDVSSVVETLELELDAYLDLMYPWKYRARFNYLKNLKVHLTTYKYIWDSASPEWDGLFEFSIAPTLQTLEINIPDDDNNLSFLDRAPPATNLQHFKNLTYLKVPQSALICSFLPTLGASKFPTLLEKLKITHSKVTEELKVEMEDFLFEIANKGHE